MTTSLTRPQPHRRRAHQSDLGLSRGELGSTTTTGALSGEARRRSCEEPLPRTVPRRWHSTLLQEGLRRTAVNPVSLAIITRLLTRRAPKRLVDEWLVVR